MHFRKDILFLGGHSVITSTFVSFSKQVLDCHKQSLSGILNALYEETTPLTKTSRENILQLCLELKQTNYRTGIFKNEFHYSKANYRN